MPDPKPLEYSNESTRRSPTGGTRWVEQPVVDSSDPSDTDTKIVSNVTGVDTEIKENTKGKEVKEALDENDKPLGFKAGAFNNDGRSDTKFQQRINKAESEGRYGKKQRLQNRHANFLKNQGEKAVKAGGTLNLTQQTKINEAQQKAGGTKVGNFLREKPITGAIKDAGTFVKSIFK